MLRRIAIGLVLALLVALPAMAQEGASVDRVLTELVREYRSLAEKGDAESQFRLGVHYNLGWGVPQDHAEAAEWYRKAAERGFLTAMSYLGEMYVEGKGVPQNFVRAHMWFSLVVEDGRFPPSGLARIARKRHRIAKRMTPAQIAKAKDMTLKWLEKHKKK